MSACACTRTPIITGRGPPGRAVRRIGHALVVLLSVVLVGVLLFGGCVLLKRQGVSLPALGVPNLFGTGVPPPPPGGG